MHTIVWRWSYWRPLSLPTRPKRASVRVFCSYGRQSVREPPTQEKKAPHTIFSQKVWWISWKLSFILGPLTVAPIKHPGGRRRVHLLHAEGRSEGGSEGSIVRSGGIACNAAAKVSEGRG